MPRVLPQENGKFVTSVCHKLINLQKNFTNAHAEELNLLIMVREALESKSVQH